jgi:hypothetical protein
MLSFLFKLFNPLKPKNLAKSILDDIYNQSKPQMLEGLKYTKTSFSNSLSYEEKLIDSLSKALITAIDFDLLAQENSQERTATKQVIVNKLLEEAKKCDSTYLEIHDTSGGWGNDTQTEKHCMKGLSYSRREIGYVAPDGHYELYAINFPLSLFSDPTLLSSKIYASLETHSKKLLKADFYEKNGLELMTL